MTHLTAAWAVTSGALSLEGAISVSEEAMERGGLAGRTVEVPRGHVDDPAYQAAIAPLNDYVRRVTGRDHIRIYTSAYTLRAEGDPIALTDGMNYIIVRPRTNEMTILHECAHIICATPEGEGHSRRFAETARDLYSRYIGPEAGAQFWSILAMGQYV